MIVLGLNDNHDASAALVVDGRLVAATNQERLDRTKNSGAFPWDAIDEVLRLGGVRREQVDVVRFGSHFTPASALRRFQGVHHGAKATASQYSPLLNAYVSYQSVLRKAGLWPLEARLSRRILASRLRGRGFRGRVGTMDHHAAHAWSVWGAQPWDDGLLVTMDAMGDGLSATVSVGEPGGPRRVFAQSGFAATNTYYSRITEWLGFRPNRHEGKTMGLAAYAEAPPELVEHLAGQLAFVAGRGRFSRRNYLVPHRDDDAWHEVLRGYSREEVAAALQRNLEAAVCGFVAHWCARTGQRRVGLSGGITANVKLNQRIAELGGVDAVFVDPNMTDGGLASGAARAASGAVDRPWPHVYLGHAPSDGECEAALRDAELAFSRPDDLAEQVAARLAAGQVVARCAGRMEWGPRALGNRSVLYRADDPGAQDRLNRQLQRTEFMPFAPMTLWEERTRCYLGLGPAEQAARFMTICVDCTDAMKAESPAAVHVDGTARPQLLRREDNPAMHAILRAYRERTGRASVLNTSFNMHEEPIVRSAADGVAGFLAAGLDALVLGPFLAWRPGSEGRGEPAR